MKFSEGRFTFMAGAGLVLLLVVVLTLPTEKRRLKF
jgi:hypothetical protein